jgi:hypothetical protein
MKLKGWKRMPVYVLLHFLKNASFVNVSIIVRKKKTV